MSTFRIRQAARHIRQGGVIAYPTEAVYGLGCDPWNAAAVMRLLELKRRPVDKGLILIAANYSQLEPFIQPLTRNEQQILQKSWPGPTTWLLRPSASAPPWITGNHPRIATRITAHPLAKALCETTGFAIVSTSANVSQQAAAKTPLEVRRYFGTKLDYVLTGPLGDLKYPTQIKDIITGQTLRQG